MDVPSLSDRTDEPTPKGQRFLGSTTKGIKSFEGTRSGYRKQRNVGFYSIGEMDCFASIHGWSVMVAYECKIFFCDLLYFQLVLERFFCRVSVLLWFSL